MRQQCEGTKTVDLNGYFDPPTVHRLLQYLYEDDYNEEACFASAPAGDPWQFRATNGEEDTSKEDNASQDEDESGDPFLITRLLNNTRVHALATAFDLKPLIGLAAEKITRDLEAAWSLVEFSGILEIVYASIEDTASSEEQCGLRGLLVAVCVEHLEDLLAVQNFRNLLRGVPDLASAILTSPPAQLRIIALEEGYEEEMDAQRRLSEADHENAMVAICRLNEGNSAMQTVLRKLESIAQSELLRMEEDLLLKTKTEIETVGDSTCTAIYQSITSTPKYQQSSFEELRLATCLPKGDATWTDDTLRPLLWKMETLIQHSKSLEDELERKTSDLKAKQTEVIKLRQQHESVESDLRKQIADLTIKEIEATKLREDYQKLKTRHDTAIAEPAKWKECRNCRADMNGYFAPDSAGSEKITWRCKYCRARHGDLASL